MTIHEIAFFFASSFVALFPVVNPIGNSFVVDGFIKDLDNGQRNTAIKKVFINSLLIGIGSLVIGHFILLLFGLAIPVIQVGGGIIICKTGMEMLSGSSSSQTDSNQGAIDNIRFNQIEQKLFYPISFPIVVGAGTISVILTLMANGTVKENFLHTGINYLVIAVAFFFMLAILYVLLMQGHRIMKKLGDSGNLIINKLVAFITLCVGIQIMITGIAKIFHLSVL
jgi:MarC family membrane protein